MDYGTLKSMARTRGICVRELCALAPANDPFYIGRKSQLAAARWFADLWERFGYTQGVHLRRVHYRIVSQDPPVSRPDGEVYENSLKDWAFLISAGKWARYLGLVDPAAFVDRRNPEAMIFARWQNPTDFFYTDPTPRFNVAYDDDEWRHYALPELPELPDLPDELPDLPVFDVDGYSSIQQDFHVEVWVEKTTMNDVLKPLCRKYAANLVTGAGEMSITAVVDFMRRVRQSERPARILYVSDYDPAGLGMPISVARKIEFFQRQNGDGDMDIRLRPVVLTGEQVADYDLPRVPVKDTDSRKSNWERDHGEGQVELDALEALHEGELESIVEQAILCYYDPDLSRLADEQRDELTAALADRWDDVLACYQERRGELEADYATLRGEFDEVRVEFTEQAANFQERIDDFQSRVDGIKERGWELYQTIGNSLGDIDVDAGDYPLPEPDLPLETNGVLYVSSRPYLTQLESYQDYRHGANGTEEKRWAKERSVFVSV